jgi:hypothetical protein
VVSNHRHVEAAGQEKEDLLLQLCQNFHSLPAEVPGDDLPDNLGIYRDAGGGRKSPDFQNFAESLLHGLHLLRREHPDGFLQTLLGHCANLIDNGHYGPALTSHWHQEGRTRLRRTGEWDYNYRPAPFVNDVH